MQAEQVQSLLTSRKLKVLRQTEVKTRIHATSANKFKKGKAKKLSLQQYRLKDKISTGCHKEKEQNEGRQN